MEPARDKLGHAGSGGNGAGLGLARCAANPLVATVGMGRDRDRRGNRHTRLHPLRGARWSGSGDRRGGDVFGGAGSRLGPGGVTSVVSRPSSCRNHRRRPMMTSEQCLSVLGAVGFGALIGWFVYYINRYRKGDVQFSDLTTVIAIIGGGVVVNLFQR